MPSPVRRQAAALTTPTVLATLARQCPQSTLLRRRRSPSNPRRRADGGEGYPDEFKEFTDQQLQSKITRLRAVHFRTPDGGEKLRRMVYRVEKELDRRRAARPMKDEEDAEEFKNFTDQDLRPKIKRSHPLNGSTPGGGKKLRKCVCQKELDHHHAARVETGQRQTAQTASVNDPNAFVPQVENTSNHAPLVESNGGLSPFASTNLEGEGATGTNLGAEEVEPTTSTCSGQKGEKTREKGKHSQIGGVLENNLDFKMKHTQQVVEQVKEAPKQEDRFTIEKCVGILEAIEELTDMEKAKVLKLFKCGLNREFFMTRKSASVRLIWLRSEIYA